MPRQCQDEPYKIPKIIHQNVHNRYKSAISGVSELSQFVQIPEMEKPKLNMVFSSADSDENNELDHLSLEKNVYVDKVPTKKTTPKFDLIPTHQIKKPNIFINDQNEISDLSFNLNNPNNSSFLTP